LRRAEHLPRHQHPPCVAGISTHHQHPWRPREACGAATAIQPARGICPATCDARAIQHKSSGHRHERWRTDAGCSRGTHMPRRHASVRWSARTIGRISAARMHRVICAALLVRTDLCYWTEDGNDMCSTRVSSVPYVKTSASTLLRTTTVNGLARARRVCVTVTPRGVPEAAAITQRTQLYAPRALRAPS
jgi:hypothetical protein